MRPFYNSILFDEMFVWPHVLSTKHFVKWTLGRKEKNCLKSRLILPFGWRASSRSYKEKINFYHLSGLIFPNAVHRINLTFLFDDFDWIIHQLIINRWHQHCRRSWKQFITEGHNKLIHHEKDNYNRFMSGIKPKDPAVGPGTQKYYKQLHWMLSLNKHQQ